MVLYCIVLIFRVRGQFDIKILIVLGHSNITQHI